MKKQFLVCDDPQRFLMEHIIKGDSSDGIPNVLSDDDTFMIDGKRQKPCSKKRVEEVIDDPYNDAWKVNFERNQTMIDMTKIPDEYESLILEEFEKDMIVNDRSKLLDYFIKNKLKNLMSSIGDF
jgi:Tfp pilus assembly PilM family ATPase